MLVQYCKNISGVFAIKVALALPVLLFALGVGIDTAKMVSLQSTLRDATDSAALKASVAFSSEDTQGWRDNSKELLIENIKLNNSKLEVENIVVDRFQGNLVKVSAEAKLTPMFPTFFGLPQYKISAASVANLPKEINLEIAIALDSTNSMAGSTGWTTAVNTVETLLEEMKAVSGERNFNVTLIPFQDRVNIGTDRSAWLNGAASAGWTGCVEPREQWSNGFNWAVDAESPASAGFTELDMAVAAAAPLHPLRCPNIPITGPTADPAVIGDAAKSMTSAGSGRMDVGLAWAWRALSTSWTNRWGVSNYPGNHEEHRKIAIFMSDGKTVRYEGEMSQEADWGWNMASKVGMEHIEYTCERMKADGIELFILRLPGNDNAEPYFRNCASSPAHYYEGTQASDLSDFFIVILRAINEEVRIVY